jgi:hypothetical protein
MNHLAETARHYANLAEQYRTELAEEQQLNEDLLGLVDALCEELDIDVEDLLEMALTKAAYEKRRKMEDDLIAQDHKGSYDYQDQTHDLLRSDKVHDETGKVVHKGAKGLGWSVTARDPSDEDVNKVQGVVGKVGHIVAAPDDPDYATYSGDIESTDKHPVHRRILKPAKPKKAPAPKTVSKSASTTIGRFSSASKKKR